MCGVQVFVCENTVICAKHEIKLQVFLEKTLEYTLFNLTSCVISCCRSLSILPQFGLSKALHLVVSSAHCLFRSLLYAERELIYEMCFRTKSFYKDCLFVI